MQREVTIAYVKASRKKKKTGEKKKKKTYIDSSYLGVKLCNVKI